MVESQINVNENLILHYKGGRLCSVEKPLDKVFVKIDIDCTIEWFKNKLRHRDNDLPALIYKDGMKVWVKKGKIHRDNRPALISKDGTKVWYKDDEIHREGDLPAIVYKDGRKEWWVDGEFVRKELK